MSDEETDLTDAEGVGSAIGPAEADAIVADAARVYFAGCRERIDPFVRANFSIAGSARLHRRAVGWDLLKAPANVALSVPQILLRLGSGAAGRLGSPGLARRLDRDIFLATAVAGELRWRLMTDLLRLPFVDAERVSADDGLAEAILAHPQVQALLAAAGRAAAARGDDPAFRARLEASLAGYTGTRAAAAEITTGLVALGTGAVAFQKATPGALALGPVLAGTLAQSSAIAGFPLGSAAGGLWYGAFPAQASAGLVTAATAGVMGVAAVATAFAGMISDPVQRAAGLHHRRLAALVDSLEAGFRADDHKGFVAYDLYVARLMDLGDLLFGLTRTLRSA
ncbi:MAG: hypothetical protein QM699_12995 [Amaricoccus sp.]|uniref:DUF6635 family protein n=1 Tax=Amaricoccus sp. TaxID=1872485 RepID=UPI0039E24945